MPQILDSLCTLYILRCKVSVFSSTDKLRYNSYHSYRQCNLFSFLSQHSNSALKVIAHTHSLYKQQLFQHIIYTKFNKKIKCNSHPVNHKSNSSKVFYYPLQKNITNFSRIFSIREISRAVVAKNFIAKGNLAHKYFHCFICNIIY